MSKANWLARASEIVKNWHARCLFGYDRVHQDFCQKVIAEALEEAEYRGWIDGLIACIARVHRCAEEASAAGCLDDAEFLNRLAEDLANRINEPPAPINGAETGAAGSSRSET